MRVNKKTPKKILNKIMPIKALDGAIVKPEDSIDPQEAEANGLSTNTQPTQPKSKSVNPMQDTTEEDEGGTNLNVNWNGKWNGQAHPQVDTANLFAGTMQLASGLLPNTPRKNNIQPLSMGEQRDPYGVRGSGATFEDGGSIPYVNNFNNYKVTPEDRDSYNKYTQAMHSQPGATVRNWDHNQDYQKQMAANTGFDFAKLPYLQADMIAQNQSMPGSVSHLPSGLSPADGWDGTQTKSQQYMQYQYVHQDSKGNQISSVDTGTQPLTQNQMMSIDEPVSKKVIPDDDTASGFSGTSRSATPQTTEAKEVATKTEAPQTGGFGSSAKHGIHIKPENKGKFTAYKKRTGKTTAEALHSKDAHVRQMANFARNAKKWHHGEDGLDMDYYDEDLMQTAAAGIRMLGQGNVSTMSDSANPMFKFEGPSHEDGGIPLEYGGQLAEVQGGETGHISPIDGSLHVDGAMKMPNLGEATKGLSGRSFQAIGKEIGKKENKASNMGNKANNIIDSANPRSKFDSLAIGSAMVLNDAASQNLSAIEAQKQHIANIQESMRTMADTNGVDNKKAHKLFGKDGVKIKAETGFRFDKNPVQEEDPNLEYNNMLPYVNQWQADPTVNARGYTPMEQIQPKGFQRQPTTPIQQGRAEQIGVPNPIVSPVMPNKSKYSSLADFNKVHATDFLPAAKYLTETPDSVPTGQINPNLKVPYQISLQDRLNNNQSTFNAIAKQNPNNYAALSALAAQKYEADNGVSGEEFRMNQGIANQVSNENTGIMNEAQRANVQLNMDQLQKQSIAKSNTEAHKAQALAWISDHISQKAYENNNIRLDEMRYGYRPYKDENGNMQLKYVGPDANLAGSGSTSTGKEDVTREYDSEGNLLKTTKKSQSKWGGMFKNKKAC